MDKSNPHIDLIIKHLTGNASAVDEQILFDWLKKSDENNLLFKQTKKAWEIANENLDPDITAIDIDDEWQKIEKNLGLAKESTPIRLNNYKRESKFSWMQMAAVIVLLITIGGGLFYFSQPSKTSLVAVNSISENKLPDGSDIVLKTHSSLIYTEKYNKEYRKVTLKGEAYFEVKPDKTKPFIVEAGKITVKVLGTTFLVKNNEDKNQAEVIVNSGRVLVYNTDNKSDSLVLLAGEKAVLNNETHKLNKAKNQNQNYLSWKTKMLNFDNASLTEVVETINETYNSKINIQNESIKKCTLTVSFNNQSLESVLKVLEATIDIKIIKKGNKIAISGKGCENEQTN